MRQHPHARSFTVLRLRLAGEQRCLKASVAWKCPMLGAEALANNGMVRSLSIRAERAAKSSCV